MHSASLPIAISVVLLGPLLWLLVIRPRRQMEKRARAILKRHPGARTTVLEVAFESVFHKRREMRAAIEEMQKAGWTFVRATRARGNHLVRRFAGGVILHFIKARGPIERW